VPAAGSVVETDEPPHLLFVTAHFLGQTVRKRCGARRPAGVLVSAPVLAYREARHSPRVGRLTWDLMAGKAINLMKKLN
jgi:hypothetical protein